MNIKQFQIEFSEEGLKRLEEISQQLNLLENEVISKRLKLIALHAKTQEKVDVNLIKKIKKDLIKLRSRIWAGMSDA